MIEVGAPPTAVLDGWRRLPLRRIGATASGSAFPPQLQGAVGNEIPFYKVKHLGLADGYGVLPDSDDTIDRRTAASLGATVFPRGTLVYAKVGAALTLGRVRTLARASCIDNNMAGLIPFPDISERFLFWAMTQVDFALLVNPGAVPSLSDRNLLDYPVLLPAFDLQHKIADYLDRETAQIDTLIAKQEQLVATLRERKVAMVSEAVTGGLHDSVAYRDTGVPWLDRIPRHWRLKPLWSLFDRVKDVNHPEEQMLSVFREYGVVIKVDHTNINKTAENRNIYQLVHPGWLVANRMKAWQGSVGISRHRGIVSGHYICFAPHHGEDAGFLNWLFRSRPYTAGYAYISRGVRIGQAEIDNDDYRLLPVLLPPIEEQREIAGYLDAQSSAIDELIAKAERFIQLAKERRSALITAAVTGQIDVRAA